MDHEAVLWNCACELHHKISDYTNEFKGRIKIEQSVQSVVPYEIKSKVAALESLRHFLCDMKNRYPVYFKSGTERPEYIQSADTEESYEGMVGDIDATLHSYQEIFETFSLRYEK